jgi:hypothetical protein
MRLESSLKFCVAGFYVALHREEGFQSNVASARKQKNPKRRGEMV